MRIATANWYTVQSSQMLDLQGRIARTQQQIASGRRLTSAADDPLVAARADSLRRSTDGIAQAERNAATLQGRLETSSGALDAAASLMVRLRELALMASNDTLSASDRSTIGIEVEELRGALLDLANTRDADGAHVFAGASTDRPAFGADSTGRIVWQGRGEAHEVPLGREQRLLSGDPGDRIFASPTPEDSTETVFDLLSTFAALLTPPTDGAVESEASRAARSEGMDRVLDRLQTSANRITDTEAAQGARLARLDAERGHLRDLSVEWQIARGALEGADITAAVVELEQAMTVLRAVQASFGRVASLSLFASL